MNTDIFVGNDVLSKEKIDLLFFDKFDHLILLQEEFVAQNHSSLLKDLYSIIPPKQRFTILGGETEKNTTTLFQLLELLHTCNTTRHSLLIIIGGGAILDMGGFAGAIFKRGINTLYIPTTLMSMIDASIGGKTAIDHKGIKNLLGAFHSPLTILSCPLFLSTLPEKEILSGFWEIVKHSFLSSKEDWTKVRSIDPLEKELNWERIIKQNIDIKLSFVLEDPLDVGIRRYLNLGHTIGHAFEAYSFQLNSPHKRKLSHGEAVAFGLICELFISHIRLGFDLNELCNLVRLVRQYHSPYPLLCKEYPKIIELMKSDKKNKGTQITIIGLSNFGNPSILEVNHEEIKDSFDFFRETFGQ